MTAQQILQQAKKYGVCSMLTGKETTSELMKLIFTPQGIEFCTKFNFPDIDTFQKYKGFEAERNGIYVNTDVELHNVECLLLVGNTSAVLTYNDPTKSHHVILMHGAKATIKASGYAVVFVVNTGGTVKTEISDFAKVL